MSELAIAEQDLADANRIQAAAALRVAVLRYSAAIGYPGTMCCAPPSPHPASRIRVPLQVRTGHPGAFAADACDRPLVYIVQQDAQVRSALLHLVEANGLRALAFADGTAFLASHERQANACLLADTGLSDLGGLSLLLRLGADADPLPVILTTDSGDIAMAINAMKAGAVDFIEKPIGAAELIASILRALSVGRAAAARVTDRCEASHHFEALTVRQRQIMTLVLSGHPSKNIATDLGISQRTVENHRAAIMRKSGSKSLPALARLALAAGETLPN
ncbi:MAG: response regulator transcription factor [Sandaracinobacteroides sp.]